MPGYRDDLDGKLRQVFRGINPDSYSRAGGNPETISRLIEIEKRRLGLIKKVKAHSKRYEEVWATRDVYKQMALEMQRGQLAGPAPKPPPDKDPKRQAQIEAQKRKEAFDHRLKIARRNVQARATRRLTALNSAAARMRNAVLRNAPSQRQAQNISRDFNIKNSQKM